MRTRSWFGATLVSISACLLLVSPTVLAGNGPGASKLEGAWVAKVVEVPGGQWSYVLSPDASGRRAFGHGSIDAGFDVGGIFGSAFEPSDASSPILINLVMTGPDTAAFYAVWYGLKRLDPPSPVTEAIVYIGVVTGETKFVAPGKSESTHDFAIYAPTQDGDGDGFPDEGEATPYMFTVHTVDTRLPAP